MMQYFSKFLLALPSTVIWKFSLIVILSWLSFAEAFAQGGQWTGESSVTESVTDIMARDRSQGLRPPQPTHVQSRNSSKRIDNPDSPKVPQWPPSAHPDFVGDVVDPKAAVASVSSAKTTDTPLVFDAQTGGTNFLGPVLSDSGWYPPNAIGAVGPAQILVVVNGRIRTYNKSGVADGAIDTDTNNFFNSVRNGANTSDSRAVFDFLSQRWFVSMLNIQTAPNRLLIAVSSGATITASTGFSFFQFTQDQVAVGPGSPGGSTVDNGLGLSVARCG